MCGLTDDPDPMHWKRHNPAMRQRMKALQLGDQLRHGRAVAGARLDRHPLIASDIIETAPNAPIRASGSGATTWCRRAMLERRIESVFGWPLHISTSPNKRTLYNFPMQGGGAEMLRLAAWRLCEAGIVPNMLIHDGILLEVRQRGADRAGDGDHASGRTRRLQRLRDRRRRRPEAGTTARATGTSGRWRKKMWATIMDALATVKAVPRKAALP